MSLSPVIWTPTFSFSTLGDLTVAYTAQQGDYFQDPATGLTILRFHVTFVPTFTTAGGPGFVSGHGLTQMPGSDVSYTGPVVGADNGVSIGPLVATSQGGGKIHFGSVPNLFLNATTMFSGHTYDFSGEIVLATVPPA